MTDLTKLPILYYKVGNMIFKNGYSCGFKRYELGNWVDDEKWFGKIIFGDFADYERITESEAMAFIKEYYA